MGTSEEYVQSLICTMLIRIANANSLMGTSLQPNILVDHNYRARLADFGLSVLAEATSQNYASNRGGNARWLAPELIHPERFCLDTTRPTYASDVFSFGCVIVEVKDLRRNALNPSCLRDTVILWSGTIRRILRCSSHDQGAFRPATIETCSSRSIWNVRRSLARRH